ncbi:MAG: carotenoid oxygenase family protein [Spirochaetaceae bacterium]|nr:carotenoid oxygenase family protein [Myxococcales bacterium]MCB9724994.1 carotenoid oxygenase family protein [Spirochaetaceae bacterium]HPG24546.1 carotenoid oxygenase family protein [Myxococcota bacterium]
MTEAMDDGAPFYLRGVHAPVDEEVEAFDLPVEGAIPPELDGRFLRNGPNPASGDPGHWFLGDGMLHGVRIEGGRARWYRNRWVRTRALTEGARWMQPDGRLDDTAGLANTHVVAHAGRILALVENGYPWEVDPDLGTIGVHDFGGRLEGPMTAHPKICAETGEMHFFGYSFAPPYLRYHRIDADGRLAFSREIEIPRPVMMHDFAITRDFVIFMDLPLVFSLEAAARGGMPYAFDEAAGARLGFLPRANPEASVVWVEVEPCYVFHPLNAWNEGGRVVLDVARYPELWRRSSRVFDQAMLHRFEIDLAPASGSPRVAESPLDDLPIEFPRVEESRTGLRHRFGYAAWTSLEHGIAGRGHVRYDLETGGREIWDGGAALVASEAVFVPAGPKASEEEGWLMGYVHDVERDESAFAIWDATRLAKGPVARVALPQRVPMGFHGSWIPESGTGS